MTDESRLVEWDPKAPGEAVRYGLRFDLRVDDGVTLSGASWALSRVSDGGAGTLVKSAEIVSGDTASLLLSGGALGENYQALATVTTSDGQTLLQTAILRIRGR